MTEVLPADPGFRNLDSLAYVGGRPVGRALLKQEFSDFRVTEDLGFQPSGAGEHVYLQLRKRDISTTELAHRLAEVVGVSMRDIGYSGMKDRRGECAQWFSVRLDPDRETELAALESDHVQLLQIERNHRKLRVGSHRANHFEVLLRNCSADREAFEQPLQVISARGVPNYFGAQRFGRELSNLRQVQALFAADGAESGQPASRGGRQRRGMLYSAARAYLFNELLSTRVAAGNWSAYVPGDVLNLDGTDRYFLVQEGDWDAGLQQRLDSFDIHLTGPLAGQVAARDRYVTVGEAADIETAVLEKFPQLLAGLDKHGLQAGRRALRFRVRDLEWHWPADDQLLLRFTLPRGAYATSLLREVCIISEGEDHRT